MTPEAQDLIQKLLTKDPKQRLGYNGATEIKKHKFFEGKNFGSEKNLGIEWDALYSENNPPIKPDIDIDLEKPNCQKADELFPDAVANKERTPEGKAEKSQKINVKKKLETGEFNLERFDLLS